MHRSFRGGTLNEVPVYTVAMNGIRRMGVLHILLGIALLGCNRVQPDKTNEPRVAAALFEQFETVAYSKATLLSDSRGYYRLPEQVRNPLRLPFYLFLSGLDSLGSQARAEVLGSANAVLVGAKDFRPPEGLGPVHSQNCYVVALRRRSAFDLGKYFRQASVASAAGAPVWNWSAKVGEFGEHAPRPTSFYAAQIGQSYLLVSNNLEELKAIAGRLASPNPDTRILGEIRDWGIVSEHEVWGYRRYRHADVIDRTAAGMAYVTPEAQALIFMFDREKNSFTLRLFCVPGQERTTANINATGLFGRLHWLSEGVSERTVPLAGDLETLERLGAVMSMLGFGAYI